MEHSPLRNGTHEVGRNDHDNGDATSILRQDHAVWVAPAVRHRCDILTKEKERQYGVFMELLVHKKKTRSDIFALCWQGADLKCAKIPNGIALADYWKNVSTYDLKHEAFIYDLQIDMRA